MNIRDALSGAFDKAEAAPEAPEVVETAAPPVEAPGPDAEPAQEAGTEQVETPEPAKAPPAAPAAPAARSAKPVGAQPTAKPGVTQPTGTAQPGQPAEAKPPAAATVKPPQSWKPEVREKWAALPPEVQQEVARREREVATTLQESAKARQGWESFQQAVAPYEALIRAEGSEPLRAVGNLLQTAAALRTAPPAHKATLVANLITTFGVPVEALAAALDGQPVPAGQQQGQQSQPVDARAIAQQAEQQILQRLQQRQQQSIMAKAQQEAEAFVNSGKAEFLDDVRDVMANMLAAAAQSGLQLSMEDAYNRACALSPNVSKVLEQRKAAEAAKAATASTQRARAAASSVQSRPAAAPTGAKPADLRSQLLASWDAKTGR